MPSMADPPLLSAIYLAAGGPTYRTAHVPRTQEHSKALRAVWDAAQRALRDDLRTAMGKAFCEGTTYGEDDTPMGCEVRDAIETTLDKLPKET